MNVAHETSIASDGTGVSVQYPMPALYEKKPVPGPFLCASPDVRHNEPSVDPMNDVTLYRRGP